MMDALREKKPGDTVWVEGFRNHHRNTGARPFEVSKVGREYLYAGGSRFRLDDGYEAPVGGYSPSQRAYCDEAAYQSVKARAELETRTRRLLDSRGLSRLSDSLLDAILAELEPMTTPTNREQADD